MPPPAYDHDSAVEARDAEGGAGGDACAAELERRGAVAEAARDFGFAPTVKLEDGIARFVGWFRQHYGR